MRPVNGDGRLSPPGRIALVGAGAFGRFCLDTYARAGDFELLAVADPLPAALEEVHAPAARLHLDWQAVVADDRVEVLHLATPPHLRSAVALAALEAGKSVFCEKPLALTLPEADLLLRAAERSGTALGVNYVMRFQPAYRLLEALAAGGPMGSLRTISFENFAQSLPADHWFWDWEKSGGIFVEHGVHFFDAYARLAGPARAVRGFAPRREAVEASVEYASGVFGRFYHEFAFPRAVERTTAIAAFERGHIQVEGWIPTRISGRVLCSPGEFPHSLLPEHGTNIDADDGVTTFSVDFPDRDQSYRAGIVAGMRDVVRRHRDHTHELTVPPADARSSLALGIACQRAVLEGKRVDLIDV